MLSICFNSRIVLSKHEKNLHRISNLKPFIDQYNWKKIDFPSERGDWKKFELNNTSIGLNILFASYNMEETTLSYKRCNFKRENQVTLLMITDGE